jgi:hypothetical protein
MLTPSVSVVVPALNEARNIPLVFVRIYPDVYEVILIDGLPVDNTAAIARQVRPDMQVVVQTRQGRGDASFEHPQINGVSNMSPFGDGRRGLPTIVPEWCRSRGRCWLPSQSVKVSSSALAGSEQWSAQAVDDWSVR